jgi:hypothetical protein
VIRRPQSHQPASTRTTQECFQPHVLLDRGGQDGLFLPHADSLNGRRLTLGSSQLPGGEGGNSTKVL